MEKQIEVFEHKLFGNSRFIPEGDSFVVVAKDVVESVGNVWNRAPAIAHVPEQWRGSRSVSTPSGTQTMLVLTEQGLYFYLGRCDKPAALQYQMWIAGEVVPNIRKYGAHMTAPAIDKMLADPRHYAELFANLADERERRELLEDREGIFGNRTRYGEISKASGLPRTKPRRACLYCPRTTTTTTITTVTSRQLQLFDWD